MPLYPEEARAQQVEGKVVLKVVVRSDGTPGDITISKATPREMGFEAAAKKAVREWRWNPATKNGQPVTVYYMVVINFTLDETSSPSS